MSRRTVRERGTTLLELLVALGLGVALTLAAVSASAGALRLVARTAVRLEADDVVQLAVEAFLFDVRRAGFDPRAVGVEAVAVATPARVVLQADLDGDGLLDAGSEEVTAYACDLPGRRLSRILGAQSLPLANDVVGCALAYSDDAGAAIPAPASGLDAVTRGRVRLVTLDVALRPAGVVAASARRTSVALRVRP
jgi:Tfp pilus assembly protein PilW